MSRGSISSSNNIADSDFNDDINGCGSYCCQSNNDGRDGGQGDGINEEEDQ